MSQIAVSGNMKDTRQQLEESNKLLKAIAQAQSQFIIHANPRNLFASLIENILALTQSEYGLICEFNYTNNGETHVEAHMKARGKPYLETHDITNIWQNEIPQNFYQKNAPPGREFDNLKTWFSSVIAKGQPAIANNPATDLPLNSFLGLPLLYDDEQLLGIVGIANRPGGYDESLISYLEPFVLTCRNIIAAYRNDKKRQQVEEKLRESEQLFRANFEQAPVGIARVALDGSFLEINQKFCEVVGYSREEMLSLTFQAITHPEDLNIDLDYVRQILAGEISTYSMHKRYICKDRSLKWVNLTGAVVRDIAGEPKYFIGFVEDINQCKISEKELAKQQQVFDAFFNAAPAGLCILDSEQRFVQINDTLAAINGLSTAEHLGKKIGEILPDLEPVLQPKFDRILTDGVSFINQETSGETPKEPGVTRYWLNSHFPLVGEDSKPLGIGAVVFEISDRKATEAAVRESEERLRAIIDQAAVGIAQVAPSGEWKQVNQKLCDIVGYTREEMLSLTFQDITYPDDLEADLAYIERMLAREIDSYALEKRYIRKDGSLVWVQLTTSLVRHLSGEPKYLIKVIEDISPRKQAEQALQEREQFLASIYDGVEQAIFVIDIGENGNFSIAGMNPTGVRVTGIPESMWCGKTLEEIHGDKDVAAAAQKNYINCIEAGTTISYEECFKFQGADTHWLTTLTPLRDARGRISRIIGTANNITERKQAELALRDREQFLASIYYGVEHPIFVIDVLENGDFRYAGMNPAGLRVSSTSIEQLCGKTPEQVYPEAIAASMRQHYIDCLNAGTSISYEEGVVFFGVETWWNTTLTPLRDMEGKIYRIIGMTLNVTPRKQTEEALRESQHFIQRIAEASPNILYLYDMIEERNIYVNREITESLGYTDDEVQKMGAAFLPTLVHPDDFVKLPARYKEFNTAKDGEIFELEYRMKHKDGSWRWLVSRESVFSRTVDGKPKQRIGTATDITDRKLAEEALQRSEAQFRKLAEREVLLNRLANQIRNSLDINTILETTVQEIRSLLQLDSCLFIWYLPHGQDANSKLPAWHVVHEAKNSDLPALLGYYLTDATGICQRAIAALEIIRIDDIETLTNPIERQFFVTLGYKSLLDVPLQTSSGAIGMIACGSCIDRRGWKDDELELVQAIALQLAIAISQAELYAQTQNSARIAQEKAKQLELTLQELQQTQAQLIQSEKMSSLGQMVAGIAHEINNPTSFIYSNIIPASTYISDLFNLLALYQKHYPDPIPEIQAKIAAIELDFVVEDLPKLLNSMEVGANRIRDIVRSLRTFSRLDEADMKQVDIHEGIDSTLMILEHRLKKVGSFSGIQIIKEYEDLPLVECYAGQLNQVFMNILLNAIDALEEIIDRRQERSNTLPMNNQQLPTIRICSSVVDGNQVLIKIADNGPGMTEEVQRRLFDPFFTTKPVGSGTGLGMSISYQIIEKHGGQLQCISSPGQGAEFLIYIPIKSIHQTRRESNYTAACSRVRYS